MKKWELPPEITDKSLKLRILQDQTKLGELEMEAGALGKIWGTKHSANNIAGFSIIIGAIVIGLGVFCLSAENVKNLLIQAGVSIISLALGYIFGSNKKEKHEES